MNNKSYTKHATIHLCPHTFLEDSLFSDDVIKFQIKFNKIIPHCLLSIILLIKFSYCLPECPEIKCNLNYNPSVKKIIF